MQGHTRLSGLDFRVATLYEQFIEQHAAHTERDIKTDLMAI